MDELKQLLATFADAHGVSGYEGDVSSLLAATLAPLVDRVSVDTMGNVIGTRDGAGPTIMIAAHMDEIGAMVKYIDDKGFLRFVPLGGWYDQMLLGQRVFIHTGEGRVTGVIGSKPPHIMDEEDRKKPVRQRVVFHPLLRAAFSLAPVRNLLIQAGSKPTADVRLRKAAGILKFSDGGQG